MECFAQAGRAFLGRVTGDRKWMRRRNRSSDAAEIHSAPPAWLWDCGAEQLTGATGLRLYSSASGFHTWPEFAKINASADQVISNYNQKHPLINHDLSLLCKTVTLLIFTGWKAWSRFDADYCTQVICISTSFLSICWSLIRVARCIDNLKKISIFRVIFDEAEKWQQPQSQTGRWRNRVLFGQTVQSEIYETREIPTGATQAFFFFHINNT